MRGIAVIPTVLSSHLKFIEHEEWVEVPQLWPSNGPSDPCSPTLGLPSALNHFGHGFGRGHGRVAAGEKLCKEMTALAMVVLTESRHRAHIKQKAWPLR